jgi:hypothetical protein
MHQPLPEKLGIKHVGEREDPFCFSALKAFQPILVRHARSAHRRLTRSQFHMVQLGVRRAVYYITVAYAQLEKGILVERVKTGMARAKMQNRRLGRPRAVDGEMGTGPASDREGEDEPAKNRRGSWSEQEHSLSTAGPEWW